MSFSLTVGRVLAMLCLKCDYKKAARMRENRGIEEEHNKREESERRKEKEEEEEEGPRQ